MKEKIYCSQCHNSVYFPVSYGVVVPLKLKNEKICLKCFAHGKVLHRNALINGCTDLLPEDVNKLRAGIWTANTTDAVAKRGFLRKCSTRSTYRSRKN